MSAAAVDGPDVAVGADGDAGRRAPFPVVRELAPARARKIRIGKIVASAQRRNRRRLLRLHRGCGGGLCRGEIGGYQRRKQKAEGREEKEQDPPWALKQEGRRLESLHFVPPRKQRRKAAATRAGCGLRQ